MKKLFCLLSISFLFFVQTSAQNESSTDYMLHIQEKIDHAFLEAMRVKAAEPLLELKTNLEQLSQKNSNHILEYWKSYTAYYLSICYLTLEDKKMAKETIMNEIEHMEDLEDKNSEDYALLACEQSYSCQFRMGMTIPFVAKRIFENCELALEADSTNLRAYYIQGSHDFYTPEMFGGGKIAEKMLLKAISLPDQKVKNPYLPSWGKKNAYELLIRWYIRKENWALAQKYYKEGVSLYPEDVMLQKLKAKIQSQE